jgi:hypothetical protein
VVDERTRWLLFGSKCMESTTTYAYQSQAYMFLVRCSMQLCFRCAHSEDPKVVSITSSICQPKHLAKARTLESSCNRQRHERIMYATYPQGPGIPAAAVKISPLTPVFNGSTTATYNGAISAGCKILPYGLFAVNIGMCSLRTPCVARKGVSVSPGATALTRIPAGASCRARERVRWVIAALLAP